MNAFRSSREAIIRTQSWAEATEFYEKVLGLPVTMRTGTIMGFETGAFCLYVEKGAQHAPVYEFLVADLQAAKRKLINEEAAPPRCYLRDPYGLVFNLAESAASQRGG